MNIEEIKKAMKTFPPGFFGANLYNEEEINAAVRVIYNQSPFRHYGKKSTAEATNFEAEAAKYYGVKHACATNSGTGALMLAMHALDIGPGDEVIAPAFFWIAISNAILLRGAMPVICEVDATLNIDPEDLVKKITKRTKCVVAVHMFGGQADIVAIQKVCKEKGIKLLEDFSQCNGGAVGRKKLGSYGDVAITSLQLNKAITSGEGGLLLTNTSDYAGKVAARSDLGYGRKGGISSTEKENDNTTIGEGRRFNEISAAVMRVQLRKLPMMVEALRASKKAISNGIKGKGDFEFRKVVDAKGDFGSTQTLIFSSREGAEAFQAAGKRLFADQWFTSHMINFGQHIYFNCTNMVRKLPVLPGGFPWNLPENKGKYNYDKGSCPASEALLARSVGWSIAPDLNEIQRDAITEALCMVLEKR